MPIREIVTLSSAIRRCRSGIEWANSPSVNLHIIEYIGICKVGRIHRVVQLDTLLLKFVWNLNRKVGIIVEH